MKIQSSFFIGFFISISFLTSGQQFWIENWTGSTCNKGCTSYSGPNGTWSTASTGYNGPAANVWYFSKEVMGGGRGQTNPGNSGTMVIAHIGNVGSDPGAYNLPLSCFSGDCWSEADDSRGTPSDYTSTRLESPAINCTGKSTITLSFNYSVDGIAGHDYMTVWYYNGSTWSLLSTPLPSSTWENYSISLPSNANNNPDVRIGFNWFNDTSQIAMTNIDFPSIAIDSIILSGTTIPKPVAAFKANVTSTCEDDNVVFTDQSTNYPTSWNWTFTGGTPATSTQQNPTIVYNTPGNYTVELEATNGSGSNTLTKTNYIQVKSCAGIKSITDSNIFNLYPNPSNNVINLEFNKAIGTNTKIDIIDIAGRLISTEMSNAVAGKIIPMDISNLVSGTYVIRISNGNTACFKQFIKQ